MPTGSVSALFQVRATSKGEAEMLARRVMAEALERTGLDKPAKTVHFVAVTPSPAVGVGPRARCRQSLLGRRALDQLELHLQIAGPRRFAISPSL